MNTNFENRTKKQNKQINITDVNFDAEADAGSSNANFEIL